MFMSSFDATMTDRTPEQLNSAIDRTLEISAENTRNISVIQQQIGSMAGAIEQLALATDRRLQQHDLELDDHDVRVERLERDHVEHGDRMDKLDALLTVMQADRQTTLQILQMMTARFAGEPPATSN
jgi:TolA-binding protein